MDADAFPNFGNAYPAAVTPDSESASWNPALRPDSIDKSTASAGEDLVDDDDFFGRYQGATDENPSYPRSWMHKVDTARDPEGRVAIPTSQSDRENDTSDRRGLDGHAETVPEPDAFEPARSVHHEAGPPSASAQEDKSKAVDTGIDTEAPLFRPDESSHTQARQLDEELPPDGQPMHKIVSTDTRETEPPAPNLESEGAAGPAERYEYQAEDVRDGMVVNESEHVPLMYDEQPPPTPGTSTGAHARILQLSGDVDVPLGPPHPGVERSFTSDFVQANRSEQQSEVRPVIVDDGWPAAGDDATFGELLDEQLKQVQVHPGSQLERSEAHPVHTGKHLDTVHVNGRASGLSSDSVAQQSGRPPIHEVADTHVEQTTGEAIAAAFAAALGDGDVLDEDDDDEELLEDEENEQFIDPNALFGGDDELLEDDFLADHLLSRRAAPQRHLPPQSGQRPRAGHGDSFHSRSAGTPDTGLQDLYSQPWSLMESQQSTQAQRPPALSAQSFSDKSKGGYQSPYDLPMEVVKPRRSRPQPLAQPVTAQSAVPPPPRSSSFTSHSSRPSIQSPPPSATHGTSTASGPRPPITSGVSTMNGLASIPNTPKSESGFFADLPITSKPRSRATYTPQQHPTIPPTTQIPTRSLSSDAGAPVLHPSSEVVPQVISQQALPRQPSTITGGLRQPERQQLFPEQSILLQSTGPSSYASIANDSLASPHLAQTQPTPPDAIPPPPRTKYSPVSASQPVKTTQYSAARGASPPASIPNTIPKRPTQPYAPRTSSPLAYSNSRPQPEQSAEDAPLTPPYIPVVQHSSSFSDTNPSSYERPLANKYTPQHTQTESRREPAFAPPVRPQTQSPSATVKSLKHLSSPERPASSGPRSSAVLQHTVSQQAEQGPVLPHRRQMSRDINFAAPQDERRQDPLQRWKGGPILRWDGSGKILTSFPRHTPFYVSGQSVPAVKCTPGDITISGAATVIPMEERNARFPGPLTARSKGKKKELLAWLSSKIEELEEKLDRSTPAFDMLPELRKRTEEKVVLWKLMRIFLDYDGSLEGNPKIEAEVRQVLLPHLAQMSQVMDLQSPTSGAIQADLVDKSVLIQIRRALFEGDRERAIWLAEEKKLWGHAMLIASTMGPDVWKQIVQSFVRSNVKSVGSDARSMAALYQIFAGNSDECVDELVPPSARAGFQMISKTEGVASSNPLEGLDKWRETLALVSSNRTAQDGLSLLSLGKLLASYGRFEAAHSCYLFCRSFAKHSGPDDTEAHFTLLGSGGLDSDETVGMQLDPILLTEIYEYACSLSPASSAASYMPCLQAFKLVHARELAAYGLRTKAQSYCQHVASAMSSTTRGSPYYHAGLAEAVASLNNFLSQTPETGGGLFSRPSMNKVSSGVGNWFNKFVSGEDVEPNETSSASAGPSNVGITSGSLTPSQAIEPSMSRPASGMDMYAAMGGQIHPAGTGSFGAPATTVPLELSASPTKFPATPIVNLSGAQRPLQGFTASNRYAPSSGGTLSQQQRVYSDNGQLNPPDTPSSIESPALLGDPIRPSSSRSMSTRYAPVPAGQGGLAVRPETYRAHSDYGADLGTGGSRRGSAQSLLSDISYEPKPILAEPQDHPFGQSPSASKESDDGPHGYNDGNALHPPETTFHEEDEDGSHLRPHVGGYEPPTSGYEPPSYSTHEPDNSSLDDEVEERKSRKKMAVDIDDDEDDELVKRAALTQKAEADRVVDEAFRKAAEADAARDAVKAAEKKGWFGGWFVKREQSLTPGPIKAKLGEENSFFYDENLKKWVNKKDGANAAMPSAPTPPPPKGPPSRTASGGPMVSRPPSHTNSGTGPSGLPGGRPPPLASSSLANVAGLPSGPPSRTSTPASGLGIASISTQNGENPSGTPLNLASGPPSRPATGLSNASSIDDLLSVSGGRKAGTVRGKKKGGRYVDVMSNK